VNKLISTMALMAAIASIAPFGAAAADSVATTLASANPQVVARMTDVARDQQLAQAEHYRGVLDPQTPAELQAYWNRVLPMLTGG
jgi:hypothetical protein